MTDTVNINANDGTQFTVARSVAEQSQLMKDLLEEEEGEDINLPNVAPKTMEKILEFLKHTNEHEYKYLEQPLQNNDLTQLVDPWYSNFIDVE